MKKETLQKLDPKPQFVERRSYSKFYFYFINFERSSEHNKPQLVNPPSNFAKKEFQSNAPILAKQQSSENPKISSKEMIIKDFLAKENVDGTNKNDTAIGEKPKYKFSLDEIQKKTQDRLISEFQL
jgi:hypothetical protein